MIRYIYGEKIGDKAIKAIVINGTLSLYATQHNVYGDGTHIKMDSYGNKSLYTFCETGYKFVKYIKGEGLTPLNRIGEVKDAYISLEDWLDNDFYLKLNL